MKIVLISLDHELYCLGIRSLSACLKQAGHQVSCLFLPPYEGSRLRRGKFQFSYPDTLIYDVLQVCSGAGLVGISLMTNQFMAAVAITKHLKKVHPHCPVIWGGIQPTVEPEICLQHTDLICQGEGEEAIVELAGALENGHPFDKISNLGLRTLIGISSNQPRSLNQKLDSLPLPDYSFQDHYVSGAKGLEKLTPTRLLKFKGERFSATSTGIRYPLLTSRGCPYSCSYCCNNVYKKLYPGQNRLRWRGIDSVIAEIFMIQKNVGPISFIHIVDDNFVAMPLNQLAEFCGQFHSKIRLPFSCQVSPLTISEAKMEILLQAGCVKVTMGVETGNAKIAESYGRGNFHKALPTALSLLQKYRLRMPLPMTCQFIIDNPYETIEETIETLKLAISLPKPWTHPIYSLMFFPGTALYQQAEIDGLIQNKQSQIYERNWVEQSQPYFQFWVYLYRKNFPVFLLNMLLNTKMVHFATSRTMKKIWNHKLFRWAWDRIG
jgi:anaerobic magnesium-protoporphyrin IX monomethyl ester cyclase